MKIGNRPRQAGFSLLEVLVAFSILALSLAVMLQIFSQSLRNADLARDRAQATSLAQSLLTEAGVAWPLTATRQEGMLDDRYHWTLEASPVSPQALAGAGTLPSPSLGLWEITVSVSWDTPAKDLVLRTLRVKPLGPT